MPDHFSFLDNGTLYVEHILKQDTAIYTCSAANKYGEVKANFNINVIGKYSVYDLFCEEFCMLTRRQRSNAV